MSEAQHEIARFERYIEMDQNNASLWISFGDVLHRAGLFDRAEQAFSKAQQLAPERAVAKSRLAALALSQQKFPQAEQMFRELLAGGEQDAALRFNLALSLYFQRRFAEAEAGFRPLCNGEVADARYYLLSCLHNLGRIDEALDEARQFVSETPSVKLRGYAALMQMDGGRMTEAVAAARQVLSESPDNPDAAAVLSTHHLESLEMDAAEQHLKVLAGREPRNVRAWQGLALAALYRQEHEEAARLLGRARECDPENTGTISTLGWVRVAQHQHARAESVFREGLAVDRNDAELHGGLATALVFQRRFDEAHNEVKLAFALDRHSFGAAFAQSILLKLEGRDELAAKLFGNVLRSSPREGGRTLLDGLIAHWRRHPPGAGGPSQRQP